MPEIFLKNLTPRGFFHVKRHLVDFPPPEPRVPAGADRDPAGGQEDASGLGCNIEQCERAHFAAKLARGRSGI